MISADPALSPLELLDRYAPGATFLGSERRTLLAEGERLAVADAAAGEDQLANLADRAAEALAEAALNDDDAVLVGAFPYAGDHRARLFVPERTHSAGPLLRGADARAGRLAARVEASRSRPSREGYTTGVADAVAALRDGALHKVVLARAVELEADGLVDVGQLLRNLAASDPRATTFAVDLGSSADRARAFVGASPELLVRRHGSVVESTPLAGSAPRAADPTDDAAQAAWLLASAKDRVEHAMVVEAIAAALAPICHELEVPDAPELTSTATMWHLTTRIRGRLADPATTSLAVALALHPTPAICGAPEADARAAIARLEPFDRGFYAGGVGWQGIDGDGEWAVAIRCAEVDGRVARLYAGAGIVADSDPAAELEETAAKAQTMLRALGGG